MTAVRRVLAAVAVLASAGCTHVIDEGHSRAMPSVGPIVIGQVDDLVSEDGRRLADSDGDYFDTAQPARCAGLAREAAPPFIVDGRPAAQAGAIYESDDEAGSGVVELVGVYPVTFDAGAALARVRRTIESCRTTTLAVTGSDESDWRFRVQRAVDSGSADIVLWSLTDPGKWACDNAFTAAYNAAIEITTCNLRNGYDVLSKAKAARQRIEALANATT